MRLLYSATQSPMYGFRIWVFSTYMIKSVYNKKVCIYISLLVPTVQLKVILEVDGVVYYYPKNIIIITMQ